MPLPDKTMPWPPPAVAELSQKWAEWSAWHGGNTDALARVYGATSGESGRPSRQGLLPAAVRVAARFFWGERRTNLAKPAERKMHVPIAADICQASADLLLSEPPQISTPEGAEETDARLRTLTGDDFHQALLNGAEVAAALGGAYLRVTWDRSVVPDRPFLTIVDQDAAVPEFAYGRLQAVTFWHVVHEDGQRVWRHLERHETDPDTGHGIIRHGLYEGTRDALGNLRPLTDLQATAGLAEALDGDDYIDTGSPGLAAVAWPNSLPNRAWRTHPLGRHLGRSDLDGLEALLDALDEAYTSLQRDLRLGRAMLIVPRSMVEFNGPGQGVSFEQNEVYAPVNAAPGQADQARLPVEQVQFAIRVQEHEQTIALLWSTLVRSAGLSAQTFGEGDSTAMTATEVAARERRSTLSKARKSRTLLPALQTVLGKMLAVDQYVFNTPVDPTVEITVALSDGIQDDLAHLAGVAATLSTALAASIETRVRLVNPEQAGDPDWLEAEVERIRDENGLNLADPMVLGAGGAGLDGMYGDQDTPEDGAGEDTPAP